MRLVRTAILPALMAMQALAPSQAAAQDDPRLVSVEYDPAQIVKVIGRPGVQATITFGDDEKIENVAVGDSQKWQITPNKRANLLFARPLEAAAVTNMTVVTDKRTYLFDLVASAKDRPIYMLSFTYGSGTDGAPTVVLPPASPRPVLASAPQAAVPQAVDPQPVAPPQPQASEELPPQPEPLATPRKRQEVAAVSPRRKPEPPASPPVPEPAPVQEAPEIRSAVDEAIGASGQARDLAGTGQEAAAASPETEASPPAKRTRRERQASRKREAEKPAPSLQQQNRPITAAIVSGAGRSSAREPGAMNFAWVRKGKKSLLPQRVYDDGRTTYLIWGEKQKMPTVLIIDERGEEASPNLTTQENSVAIAAVPGQIVLRTDKGSATLENLRQMASSEPVHGRVSVGQSGLAAPAQVNQ